ncbi:expressed unknown protein [Seminavis robusta]|uniref:Uncharacterized protein n=1 Tax=Seminavis robusta TaxID=568900 RepID=A0A9N8EKZ9_9STRA|nr:expressed unknown protein [Seminavis robusta]|eukprot:Sro1325_g262880.1 n/a (95) ;mRNA; r:8002-8286
MTETREAHPLQSVVNAGNEQKKRLSHVEVKKTADLMSSVRTTEKRTSLKTVKPVAKQDLLSEVRIEAGAAKKRLSHVETKAVGNLMSDLRKAKE